MKMLQLMVMAAALSGCALIERQQDAATESRLSKAGFRMRAATSADSDLPPREIVTRWDGETTVYIYADRAGCRCLYVGTMAQYERYRWLEARENVLREFDGAAMNAASLDDAP